MALRSGLDGESMLGLGKRGFASAAVDALSAGSDSRLGLMVQHMASFGPRSGEGEWKDRSHAATDRFDYFAG